MTVRGKRGDRWFDDDLALLRQMVDRGKSPHDAVKAFPHRKPSAVEAKFVWMRLKLTGDNDDAVKARVGARNSDAAFQAALSREIAAGRETMPVPPPEPPGDFSPRVYHREPVIFGSCALADA